MRSILFVFLFTQFSLVYSQVSVSWIKSISPFDEVKDVAIDVHGNSYLVSTVNSAVDIDPGPQINNVAIIGQRDLVIVKLDSLGNFVWGGLIGSTTQDYAGAIEIDDSNNVIITGTFSGTMDFDFSTNVENRTSNGSQDVFVLKLSETGNFLWVRTFGGTNDENVNDLTHDVDGNIYLAGFFRLSVDFDPGPALFTMSSAGDRDCFFMKISDVGDFVWAKKIGGNWPDEGKCIEVSSDGFVYIGGIFSTTIDINPNAPIVNVNSLGQFDYFLEKLDTAGNLIWYSHFGSVNNDNLNGIISSGSSIIATGYFGGSMDADFSTNSSILTCIGSASTFVQKISSNNQLVFAKSIGTSRGIDVTTDSNNDIYITGSFDGSVDFDPGLGTELRTAVQWSDAYLLKLDSLGNFIWVGTMGGLSTDGGLSVKTNSWDEVYMLGKFGQTVDLDPSSAVMNFTSTGLALFLTKFVPCQLNTMSTTSPASCQTINDGSLDLTVLNGNAPYSYQWNNGSTSEDLVNLSAGSYNCEIIDFNGCYGLHVDTVGFNPPDSQSVTVLACNSYVWPVNGLNYLQSGQYVETIQNSIGCDSIITLNLTILNSSDSVYTEQACGSYIWPWNGQTYSSSGLYHDTIPNAAGCDSIVTLDLTITPLIPIVINNTFSLPSDPNNCLGELAIDISGNGDFDLSIDNGAQQLTSTGYSLIQNLCPGVHDLHITDHCGDTLLTQFVIPVDSNYVFNNPFIDSIAVDSLGTTATNCTIYYNSIDTAYIDSIWATGNTVSVIWNIVDSNGSNFDTTSYVLNNGNGVYWLQFSVFCPTKALGDYFTVTQAINFENGGAYLVGMEDELEQMLVEVYPNPTNNEVTIAFESNEAQVIIYDTQGKLIQGKTIHSGEQISLKEVETGVYFFEVTTEKGRVVKRVVKR